MHYAPPFSGRVSLSLTPLEARSVPSASTVGGFDPRTPAATADQSTLDPQPVQVGTNDQGEAIFTVTVQPGRCNCAACRGLPPAEPAAVAPVSPSVTVNPVPAVVVAAVTPTRLFGSDLTATPTPTPAPAVVARSDSGFALLALPEVPAEAQPDVVSTPTPAAAVPVASVAPFAGTGWRWGFADPFADPVGFGGAV